MANLAARRAFEAKQRARSAGLAASYDSPPKVRQQQQQKSMTDGSPSKQQKRKKKKKVKASEQLPAAGAGECYPEAAAGRLRWHESDKGAMGWEGYEEEVLVRDQDGDGADVDGEQAVDEDMVDAMPQQQQQQQEAAVVGNPWVRCLDNTNKAVVVKYVCQMYELRLHGTKLSAVICEDKQNISG